MGPAGTSLAPIHPLKSSFASTGGINIIITIIIISLRVPCFFVHTRPVPQPLKVSVAHSPLPKSP